MTQEEFIQQLKKSEVTLAETSGETVDVLFAGDFYPGDRTEDFCRRNDFESLFNDFMPVLKSKDLSVVNLESPLTTHKEGIAKIGPNLQAHPDCIKAIRYGEFDIAALANNHIFDYGSAGLRDTMESCKSTGIKTVGAGLNLTEKHDPLYVRVKSVKAAFINITENEFSTVIEGEVGANGLDLVRNYYQITQAKKNADVVFVIIHGGNELYPLPSPRVVNLYRFFADIGATAVIGHHPHCASGIEVWKGVPIFYSLGNFLFDVPEKMEDSWYKGYTVKLSISDNRVARFCLAPYVQFKDHPGIRSLGAEAKAEFLNLIGRYSEIIQSEQALRSKWEEFCFSRKVDYFKSMFRLSRFKTRLLRRGIGTDYLIGKNDIMRALNLIRCEAHRDVILNILESSIQKKER